MFGGIGIGPIIGEAVIGPDGHFHAGLVVAAVFAACGALAAFAVPQRRITAATLDGPLENEHTSTTFMHRATLRPGIILALGIGGFTAFNAYMPEHAKTVGLTGSQWVFATYSVSCLLLRIVGARVPERVGLARAVTLACAGLISGLTVLALIPTIPGVFLAAVLLAVGMSFQYPSLMTMALNGAPDGEHAPACSLRSPCSSTSARSSVPSCSASSPI